MNNWTFQQENRENNYLTLLLLSHSKILANWTKYKRSSQRKSREILVWANSQTIPSIRASALYCLVDQVLRCGELIHNLYYFWATVHLGDHLIWLQSQIIQMLSHFLSKTNFPTFFILFPQRWSHGKISIFIFFTPTKQKKTLLDLVDLTIYCRCAYVTKSYIKRLVAPQQS